MRRVENGNRNRRDSFVGNWVGGAVPSRSQRKRLLDALRIAHRVLGVKRDRLGLGALGVGSAGRALAMDDLETDAGARGALGFANAVAAWVSPLALAISLGAVPQTVHAQTQVGGGQTTSPGGIAIGGGAACDTEQPTTVSGTGATRGIAIGCDATSIGNNSIAIGVDADATAVNTTAIGAATQATALGATALGSGATATANGTSAVGNGSIASAQDATAIGYQSVASGVNSTAIGNQVTAAGSGSIAISSNNPNAIDVASTNSVAIGWGSTVANAPSGIAMGNIASSSAANAVALGTQAAASGVNSLALGTRSEAAGINGLAIGIDSSASGWNGIALGTASQATAQNSVAVGAMAQGLGFGAVAVGNAQAAKDNAVAVGQSAAAQGLASIAVGNLAVAGADNALALGTSATADTADAVAIGTDSTATGGKAVAIGAGNTAFGDGAVAIGDPSYASGTGAFTGGANNIANADGTATASAANMASGAVAIGNANKAVGQGSVALGNSSSALAAGSLAFGDAATANNAGDVALGSGSVTSAPVPTASGTVGGTTYNFAGTAPTSTVSIGAAGAERQLQNVAAGQLSATSTDGVNGSQLFATNQKVDENTTDIANLEGDITNIEGDIVNLDNRVSNVEGDLNNINNGAGIKYFHANSTLADSQALGMDSVAIGPEAVANNAGDVALGKGSATDAAVATTGATIGGTAYSFAGSAPTSTVSVGAVGAERTITNVAAGRLSATSTDAVNGSQLFATNQKVDENTTDIANLEGDVTNLDNRVTNVEGDLNNINNGAGIKYFHANSTLADSQALGTDSVAIGPEAVANNVGDVALGRGSVTDVAVATSGTTIGGTAYSFAGSAPTSTVSVGAVGAERTITNVAAGRLTATSTDAVNGSQLFATNQKVDENTTDIANLEGDVTNLDNRVTNVEGDVTDLTTTVNNINNGAGIKYFHANSTLADSQALGTDSVAIGPEAIANNAGDVALGKGSVTDVAVATTGATIGGTAYGFAGGAPTSTVSVGAVGAERTITNVAAGRLTATSTDAVNGSQLFATNQKVDENTTDIANLEGDVTNLDNRVTTVEGDIVNLDNRVTNVEGDVTAIGDTLTNIAGDTSTTYTEANGDGLRYARTNERGLAETDAFAQGVGSTALGYQANASADNSVALGRDTVASIEGSLALGANAVSDRALAPATGTIPAGPNTITYNTADVVLRGAVSVGNAATNEVRQITNVADGTDAHDAVTIRQLAGAIGAVSASSTKYFHANSLAVDSLAVGQESIAVGPTTVVNGDNGIGMGNGAIVEQTAPGGTAIGQKARVTQADGIAFGTGSLANGIQSVAIGAGANVGHSGSVALGAGATTSVGAQTGYAAYGLAAPQNSVGEISFGSAGAERKVTNVAAGSAPTDAVNVSQLQAVEQKVTTQITDLGDRVTNVEGSVANLDNRVTNVEGSVTNLDNRVTNIEGSVTNVQNNLNDLGDTVAASLGGNTTYDSTTNQIKTELNVGGNTYNNVNDALQAIGTTASAGWNIQANGGPASNVPSNGTLNVTAGANTVVTLNGNQLQIAMADNPTFTGMVTANGGLTVGGNTTVNMGGNVVQNVGAGVAPTDAVNVGQLNQGLAGAVQTANAYTDARIADVRVDIRDLRRDSNAGIAGALAAAGLPQAFEPGRGMIAFGAGTFQGESAFALGLSRVMDDGRTVIKAGASYDTRSRAGANVGIGFQF